MVAVRSIPKARTDPAAGGFYTVREAARLLNIAHAARITAWLQGHARTAAGPVIDRQYSPIGKVQELGFWDLIEVRFVEHFRNQGVSLQSLRRAARTAREEWKTKHPFALSKARYMTDRKDVFQTTATAEHDTVLLNLVTRQYEMYVVLEEYINRGLAFDPTGLAMEWRPQPKECPNIALSPTVAFGQPIVAPVGIPTRAIFESWKAEDGSYSAVADWFEISEAFTREAVEFELGLPN